MERIKQAMERALQERQAATGGALAPESGPSLPPVTGPSAAPAHINYTQTRVFRPDADVLKRNRVIADGQDDSVIDAYRMLRTRILHRKNQGPRLRLQEDRADLQHHLSLPRRRLALGESRK